MHSFDELEGFQFLWHHVPTFAPLVNETKKVPPVLAAQRYQEVKKGAGDVLAVLTQGAREVCCPYSGTVAARNSRSPDLLHHGQIVHLPGL